MKRILFYFLGVAVIIGSCTKQSEVNEFDNLSELSKEILSKNDVLEMKNLQGFLSIDEKYSLWKLKYQTILKNDINKLSDKQIEIVRLLQETLEKYPTSSLIDKDFGENFLNNNIEIFEKEFSKKQLYFLIENPFFDVNFSIVDIDNSTATKTADGLAINKNSCTCLYDLGCPGAGNDCDKEVKCNQDKKDCGLFGDSWCKGRCEESQPDWEDDLDPVG